MCKKTLVFYTEWLEDMEDLTDHQIAELTLSLLALGRGEEKVPTEPVTAALYRVYARQIQRDIDKYDAKCESARKARERRAAAKASSENSLFNSENSSFRTEKPHFRSENENVNVNENENVNVNENENVNVNENENENVNENDAPRSGSKQASYFDDAEVEVAFKGYVDARKKMRKPMTDRAKELAVAKVKKLAADGCGGYDHQKAIAILDQSVTQGWQGLFELPSDTVKKKPGSFGDYDQRGYDSSLEGALLKKGGRDG